MANANLPSSLAPLVAISLGYWPQVTADVADAAVKRLVPFAGRVHRVTGHARAIGGGTPYTDVDVDVYLGTTKIATVPVVDGSAIAGSGKGVDATLLVSGSSLEFASGAMLHMKLIDVTGGASTPTLDGLEIVVWVERS